MGWHLEDSASREAWSLADCLRILYRHKAALAGLTCLGILAAAAVTSVQPRVYQSRATIEIQPFNEAFLDLRDIYPAAASSVDAPTYLQTQTELLQQDALLEQVARKLGLEGRPEYRSSQGIAARLRQDIRISPVRNSRVIQIVADARTAPLAADIANTLARSFVDQGIHERQASAWQTYQALQPQLDELRRSAGEARNGTGQLSRPAGWCDPELRLRDRGGLELGGPAARQIARGRRDRGGGRQASRPCPLARRRCRGRLCHRGLRPAWPGL